MNLIKSNFTKLWVKILFNYFCHRSIFQSSSLEKPFNLSQSVQLRSFKGHFIILKDNLEFQRTFPKELAQTLKSNFAQFWPGLNFKAGGLLNLCQIDFPTVCVNSTEHTKNPLNLMTCCVKQK